MKSLSMEMQIEMQGSEATGEMKLAGAIIKSALQDYYKCCLYGDVDKGFQKRALRLEKWFSTEYCDILSGGCGEWVKDKARKTVKDVWIDKFAKVYPKRETQDGKQLTLQLTAWITSEWAQRFFLDYEGCFSQELVEITVQKAIRKGKELEEEAKYAEYPIFSVDHKRASGWETVQSCMTLKTAKNLIATFSNARKRDYRKNYRVRCHKELLKEETDEGTGTNDNGRT